MKRLTLSLTVFVCAIAAPHPGWAQSSCPPTIAVAQRASAPGPEWTVSYSGYDTAVAGVMVFDGPPAEQASLVPDKERSNENTVYQTWKLPKSDRGYWLQCEYANTTAQLSRRLPPDVSRCDVTSERNVRFGGEARHAIKSVNCK
ncbi:MAG TPA: STY0301 family protein [Candidatus Acidoferrum sp.]|nr:STY0301 family protein [Candidatus Acidoferrum sp.]